MKTIICNILVIISLIITFGSIILGAFMANVLLGMQIAMLCVPASIVFMIAYDNATIFK